GHHGHSSRGMRAAAARRATSGGTRLGLVRSGRSDVRRRGVLADLEARKAAHGYVLADLGVGLLDQVAYGGLFVLDEVLLVQTALGEELFELAFHDAVEQIFRLAGAAGLVEIILALALDDVRRHVFAPDVPGVERGHVHGHVVAEALELVGAGHKVALAIHLDEHGDLSAGVQVGAHGAFGGLALRLLFRRRLASFAQDGHRGLQVAVGFEERVAAIAESRAGALAQGLHELRGDLGLSILPWLSAHGVSVSFVPVPGAGPPWRALAIAVRPRPGCRGLPRSRPFPQLGPELSGFRIRTRSRARGNYSLLSFSEGVRISSAALSFSGGVGTSSVAVVSKARSTK